MLAAAKTLAHAAAYALHRARRLVGFRGKPESPFARTGCAAAKSASSSAIPKSLARLAKTFEEDWEAKEQAAAQPLSAAETEQQEQASAAKVAKKVAKAVADDMAPVKPVFELTVRELSGAAPDVNLNHAEMEATVKQAVKDAVRQVVRDFVEEAAETRERGNESMKLAQAVILIAGALCAQIGHPAVNADSVVIQDFEKRVAAYLQLRKSIESNLTQLKTTPSQEKISHHEDRTEARGSRGQEKRQARRHFHAARLRMKFAG